MSMLGRTRGRYAQRQHPPPVNEISNNQTTAAPTATEPSQTTTPALWGAPLVERIEKSDCGCGRSFDPIKRMEVTRCKQRPASLISLCRDTVLQAVGLTRIDAMMQDPFKLQMPTMVFRDLCRLHVRDFYIDPYKVQSSDVQEGIYKAKTCFSDQKVLLQVFKTKDTTLQVTPEDVHNQNQPNYITSFKDGDFTCTVWEPTLTLTDMLKAHTRLRQPLAHSFIWKVMRDMAIHIAACSASHCWKLNMSDIKVTQSNNTVFIDQANTKLFGSAVGDGCNSTSYPKPPEIETLLHRYNPEKANVWYLGCLILEMVTTSVNPCDKRPIRRQIGLSIRHQTPTHEEKLSILKSLPDSSMKSIVKQSLDNDPARRPQAKEILRLAQQELNTKLL